MTVFFLLVLVLYGLAIWLAGPRRREAVREVGVALALSGAAVLVVLRIARRAAESEVAESPMCKPRLRLRAGSAQELP